MERYFEKELQKLKTSILRMAVLVEHAILKATASLDNKDVALAQEVISEDDKIDKMELQIEEIAINLLALNQPLAKDLRFITTGMKINAELERIADLAVNIAYNVFDIAEQAELIIALKINELSAIASKMTRSAIKSFVNSDEKLAQDVIEWDNKADDIRNSIQKEIIENYLSQRTDIAKVAVAVLLISRHLERICDHATSMAEDIIYMIRAKVVKHHFES